MPDLPAVCDTCGKFFPSGIRVENSKSIGFSNVTVGPCPRCGGTGHVPDGVYNFIGDTIELLQGPQRTVSELQRFANILRTARDRGATAEEVVETVRRETPEFSFLLNFLTSREARKELATWLTLILAIISLVLQAKQSANTERVEVNQVINNITVQEAPNNPVQRYAVPRVGRNEPCPCGSGKKYKKCHGNPLETP
jgi:hypothetical protein